jgi:hypothetical protein
VAKYDSGGKLAWATSAGSAGIDGAGALAVDGSGNAYVAGYFSGSMRVQTTAGVTTLTARGVADIFVVKLSASGKFLWAVGAGGDHPLYSDYANDLALDAAGNLFVVGEFNGSGRFGTLGLSNRGGSDLFVARLATNSGAFTRALGAGGADNDRARGIAVDRASGAAYVTGSFKAGVRFGTLTATARGQQDLYVAGISPAGSFKWLVTGGGSAEEGGTGVALDSGGNPYVASRFNSVLVTIGSLTFARKGKFDILVCRLSPSGALSWAAAAGGAGDDLPSRLALDGSGTVYLTGQFTGSAGFGSASLTSAGMADIFVARAAASSGAWLGALSAGGTFDDGADALALDGAGLLVLGGGFQDQVTLGGVTLKAAGEDVFVWKRKK